jgi:hypothetical protein
VLRRLSRIGTVNAWAKRKHNPIAIGAKGRLASRFARAVTVRRVNLPVRPGKGRRPNRAMSERPDFAYRARGRGLIIAHAQHQAFRPAPILRTKCTGQNRWRGARRWRRGASGDDRVKRGGACSRAQCPSPFPATRAAPRQESVVADTLIAPLGHSIPSAARLRVTPRPYNGQRLDGYDTSPAKVAKPMPTGLRHNIRVGGSRASALWRRTVMSVTDRPGCRHQRRPCRRRRSGIRRWRRSFCRQRGPS